MAEALFSLFADSGALLLTKFIQIGLTLALTAVVLRVAGVIAARARARIEGPACAPVRRPRLRTLLDAAFNLARIILLGLAALMVLGELGVDLTPVLASVGVATLAISLGAQTLIRDFIGGLLVLIEDQFSVGDSVQIGVTTGVVEQITLRATHVRDGDGRLVIIPNGDVRVVANASKDWARASVDLSFALDVDVEQVRSILLSAMTAVSANASIAPYLLREPQVIPWHGLSGRAVQMRLDARTLPDRQYDVARALRQHAVAALTAAGIELVVQ
jgi:small conductance mechanosensitive channel